MIYIGALFLLSMLCGCAQRDTYRPIDMGYTDDHWEALPAYSRSSIIYNHEKSLRVQQSARASVLNPGEILVVSIEGGTARMGPDREALAYKKVATSIRHQGGCENMRLQANHDASLYTHLSVCVHKDSLYIDASSQQSCFSLGSRILPVNDILRQGISLCEFTTEGNASVEDACLTVQLFEKKIHESDIHASWHLHKGKVSEQYKHRASAEYSQDKVK